MFEQTFRNVDDCLRKEAGCTAEPRLYRAILAAPVPQVSRRAEQDGATEAKLAGKKQAFSGEL
jgi:type I restriction enzyme M protein